MIRFVRQLLARRRLLCIFGHRWQHVPQPEVDAFFPASITVECVRCHQREIASTGTDDPYTEACRRLQRMVEANRNSFKTQLYAKNRAAQIQRRTR